MRKACTRILIIKNGKFQETNFIRNSHDFRFLSLDGRIDYVDEGGASSADGGDQQKVQRLLGSQQICPVPLTNSLDKYLDLSYSSAELTADGVLKE